MNSDRWSDSSKSTTRKLIVDCAIRGVGHTDVTLGKNRYLLLLLTVLVRMWPTISPGEWWQMCFWTSYWVLGSVMFFPGLVGGDRLPSSPPPPPSLSSWDLFTKHKVPEYLSSIHIIGCLAPIFQFIYVWKLGLLPGVSLNLWDDFFALYPVKERRCLSIQSSTPWSSPLPPEKPQERRRKSVELSSGLLAQGMSVYTCEWAR